MAIHSSVLELIGNTPIVKAQRLDTGVCELFLKLEASNPVSYTHLTLPTICSV